MYIFCTVRDHNAEVGNKTFQHLDPMPETGEFDNAVGRNAEFKMTERERKERQENQVRGKKTRKIGETWGTVRHRETGETRRQGRHRDTGGDIGRQGET